MAGIISENRFCACFWWCICYFLKGQTFDGSVILAAFVHPLFLHTWSAHVGPIFLPGKVGSRYTCRHTCPINFMSEQPKGLIVCPDSQQAHPHFHTVLALVKHIVPLIPSPWFSLFAGIMPILRAKEQSWACEVNRSSEAYIKTVEIRLVSASHFLWPV